MALASGALFGSGVAVFVALRTGRQAQLDSEAHLEELEQLAMTLGLRSVARFYQRLDHPRPSTCIGQGKIDQIASCLKEHPKAVLIFDNNLSPSQLRNLEKALKVHIYDRSLLILEIFLARASTAQARLQVNVARFEYLLPRLTRLWTHLERQRGGASTRGGTGEKEIETDRRQIRNRIARLKRQLQQVEQQNLTQRKSRQQLLRFALVGYTNAGKSTLMNALTQSDLEAADKLFATVDTTVRRLQLGRHRCLISDTVGFIRKLPHGLIESFKSTLAEAKEADLLLHVVDTSHPSLEEQVQTVEQTLEEIGIKNTPMLLLFNKLDLVDEANGSSLTALERAEALKTRCNYLGRLYFSAVQRDGVSALREMLSAQAERLCSGRYLPPVQPLS